MMDLPGSWAVAPLEDLVAPDGIFTDGDWVESKDQDPDGDVRLIQLADIADGRFLDKSSRFLTRRKADELNCTFLRKGDLMVARMPDPLGRCCIFPLEGKERFVTVVDVCAIRVGSAEIEPRYLMRAINSPIVRAQVSALQSGSTRKRISRKNLATVTIPVPPLDEQRRIAHRIETLFDKVDRGVESLRDAKRVIGLYRQSLLKSAFEGRLTAQWRAENADKLESPDALLARIRKEREMHIQAALDGWERTVAEWREGGELGKRPAKPRKVKTLSTHEPKSLSRSGMLPASWLWLTAESVGTVQLGRQRSPRNRSNHFPTKYIRAANLTEDGLALDDLLDMEFLPHELSTYRLEKGDLLVSEASGSAGQVGKAAIWEGQVPNCCFQNTVIRHRAFCGDFSVYLLWMYRYFYTSGKFAQVAGGVGINHLSASRFAQMQLPICSPAEQAEIVRILSARLEAVNTLQAELDINLTRAEALRQSILKQAFTGKLVPQDPDDEPAGVLLQRIRAKNASQERKRRRPGARRR